MTEKEAERMKTLMLQQYDQLLMEGKAWLKGERQDAIEWVLSFVSAGANGDKLGEIHEKALSKDVALQVTCNLALVGLMHLMVLTQPNTEKQ